MNIKTTILCVALVPGLAMLAACKQDNDADDMAAPVATAPADTMPADGMAGDSMAGDSMAGDNMHPDAMGADTMGTGDEMTFAQMDKNGDGGITQDELAPTDMLSEHFSVADADGNGSLSDSEVAQHRADMAAAP